MKYIFLGKPDRRFPHLVTGEIYDLEVVVQNGNLMIFKPIVCPYRSWETFGQNWKRFETLKSWKKARAKILLMERGEKKSFLEKFPLNRDEEEMFKESRRLKIKHPKDFVRHAEARVKRLEFAYYLFFLALLYAFVILSCAPR